MTATQWIIDGMQACLPKRCPLPFTTVESAAFIKTGVARGQVRLFDGLVGTLQVSRQSCGSSSFWCIHWQELPGGAIKWNGARWERVCTCQKMELAEPQASDL